MHSVNSKPVSVAEDWQNGGFGIYIHWPFCQAKCPYCDFNSHVSASVDQSRWLRAYKKEIEHHAKLTPDRTVDTIFFGGGTPSLMEPETVAGVLESIKSNWPVSKTLEVNLEANPTSVEAGRFHGYADAGVNRLSMGVQALNDTDLKALGRLHSAVEAIQAFDIAKQYFKKVSFDLIYARQNQTLDDWEAELTKALSLAVDHLSLYQLTIEQGTRFGDLYDRGRLRGLPGQDLSSDMYDLTQQICQDAGMPGYEVSNHAAPGSESKHNLIYWRYGDYVGIGPGAHGRLTLQRKRVATETPMMPDLWLQGVETNGTATTQTETISPEDQFAEYLMMSMRLTEGSEIERLHTLAPDRLELSKAKALQSDGFLDVTNERVIATPKGRLVLNAVLGELLG